MGYTFRSFVGVRLTVLLSTPTTRFSISIYQISMDLDEVDLKHKCSNFDTKGDFCSRCAAGFAGDGFRQLLDPRRGYIHYDLETLHKRQRDSCPLCRAILGCLRGSRLYGQAFIENCVYVVLRALSQPTCKGLCQGTAGSSPMHVLSVSLHSIKFHEAVKDIYYTLDIFAEEGMYPCSSSVFNDFDDPILIIV